MATGKGNNWVGQITTDSAPQIVLGRRRGRTLEAKRLGSVHSDLFGAMKSIADAALQKLDSTLQRPYEPNAQLELAEEHFWLRLDEVILKSDGTSSANSDDDDNPNQTAALVDTLSDVAQLESITAGDLQEFDPLFYSLAWKQADGTWVHFICKVNPRLVAKKGRIFTQYGATLKKIEQPDMALESYVDLVLTGRGIAAFNATALRHLFTDVFLVFRDLSVYINRVSAQLESSVPLSAQSRQALLRGAHGKLSLTQRLYALPERLAAIDLVDIKARCEDAGIDSAEILNDQGEFDFNEGEVGTFLDLLEGRLYDDGWTGEPRRADRFSKRTTPARSRA